MNKVWITAALLACAASAQAQSLQDARKGFQTKLQRRDSGDEELDAPPPQLFSIVRYQGPAGELCAYLGAAPKAGQKHPAILWVTGGFPAGGAGASAWGEPDLDNEQTAQAYRHAGVVMMYPTFRGSFGNGGVQEAFLGEVDDLLAALEHLRRVDYVDAERIYLGGHSTGGTLALLAAAATDRFKGVFAFGPIDDPANYGQDTLPYDVEDAREARMRAPIHYLAAIKSPTFVIEGESGNDRALQAMKQASKNPAVRFLSVKGADHFDLLSSINALIARKVAAGGALELDAREAQTAYDEDRAAARESADLHTIARLRRAGESMATPQKTRHHLYSRQRGPLTATAEAAKGQGFTPGSIESATDGRGRPYFALTLTKGVSALRDLDAVFAISRAAAKLARANEAQYDGWDVE